MPWSMSPVSVLTISSRKRLAWRALRDTSDNPFLLLSSSSRVAIGRKISCSSNRYRLVGSCIRTLVSSTNSLVSCREEPRVLVVGMTEVESRSGESECFNKIEYLLRVAWNFHTAPFMAQHPFGIDDERA